MYQVLYRKWRPRFFSDVAGQPQVTVTLQNELKAGRINHAYLFTGSRGTGKTTCAKILAKAVNCLNPQNGDPCGECENCKGLENGEIMDVVEIDAASNNGVENIRSLIEESAFTPTRAKYRVYIIDEVHMLSIGAFNALLKTLEEPPAQVVFILATTEVHKIPATILSRCQRFDFHRIPPQATADRLRYVSEQEGAELENDAALLIAALSDGALRDALSLLDRCIGTDKHITSALVRQVAGLAGREYLFSLAGAVIKRDCALALGTIDTLYKEAKDMARLSEELTSHFRGLMLIKTMKDPRGLLVMADDEFEQASAQAQKLSLAEIIRAMDVLQSSYEKMLRGNDRRTEMETAMIKICSPQLDPDMDALLARIARLERTVKYGVPAAAQEAPEKAADLPKADKPAADNPAKQKPAAPSPAPQLPPEPVNEAPPPAPIVEQPPKKEEAVPAPPKQAAAPPNFEEILKNAEPFEDWAEVLQILKKYSKTIAASFEGTQAYVSGEFLLIDSKSDIPFKLLRQSAQRDKMRVAVKEVTGRVYKLGPYRRTQEEAKKEDPLQSLAEKIKEAGVPLTEITGEADGDYDN